MKRHPKKEKKHLTHEEAVTFREHIEKIEAEHKKLQNYLDSIGVRPVGGWKDVRAYGLVTGLQVIREQDCTECQIVCFDGICDCTECGDDRAQDIVSIRELYLTNQVPLKRLESKGFELRVRSSK